MYDGGLEKAILRGSELLSEVMMPFVKLIAQKAVTRSVHVAEVRLVISADMSLAKALSGRRANAGSLLSLKLEENEMICINM